MTDVMTGSNTGYTSLIPGTKATGLAGGTSAKTSWTYDPSKSANENIYNYALKNNSSSAMEAFLNNKYSEEMSNTSISRAIKDAESAGISKYQLFQSSNASASTPTAATGISTSEENEKNRDVDLATDFASTIGRLLGSLLSSAAKIWTKK